MADGKVARKQSHVSENTLLVSIGDRKSEYLEMRRTYAQ